MRLGTCSGCQRQGVWVNAMTWGHSGIGEYCGDCFDRIPHDEPDRNRTIIGSGPNSNDPGFDNVIRALEENR